MWNFQKRQLHHTIFWSLSVSHPTLSRYDHHSLRGPGANLHSTSLHYSSILSAMMWTTLHIRDSSCFQTQPFWRFQLIQSPVYSLTNIHYCLLQWQLSLQDHPCWLCLSTLLSPKFLALSCHTNIQELECSSTKSLSSTCPDVNIFIAYKLFHC